MKTIYENIVPIRAGTWNSYNNAWLTLINDGEFYNYWSERRSTGMPFTDAYVIYASWREHVKTSGLPYIGFEQNKRRLMQDYNKYFELAEYVGASREKPPVPVCDELIDVNKLKPINKVPEMSTITLTS